MENRRNLIICPVCEREGKKEVLGEVLGTVVEVLRFHKGVTRILSEDYALQCGRCGNIVYRRTDKSTVQEYADKKESIPNHGIDRVHR
jgi:hypothetical protein